MAVCFHKQHLYQQILIKEHHKKPTMVNYILKLLLFRIKLACNYEPHVTFSPLNIQNRLHSKCTIICLNSHLKQILIGVLCSNPNDYSQTNLHMRLVKVAEKLHLLQKQYNYKIQMTF